MTIFVRPKGGIIVANKGSLRQGKLLAVFLGSKACLTAKNAEEIVVIGDADLLADFAVCHFCCGEKRDCMLDA